MSAKDPDAKNLLKQVGIAFIRQRSPKLTQNYMRDGIANPKP
jgi:hypothetical protein